jgi:N-acyl-D-amino-acid deacylase
MRHILSILVLTTLISTPALAQREAMVLMNGTIIDGSGKARFKGNLRIRDGQIVDIGAFKPAPGEATMDVNGLIVAPGFVDIHNLSLSGIRRDHAATSQVAQGITTIVLGPDGTGPIAIEDFVTPFEEDVSVNIMTLVGHGAVRRSVMADDYKRPATPDEMRLMEEHVEYAMREGAFGLSSDLRADPASYSTTDEVIVLAKMAARYGGIFVTHLRDDSAVLESITEAISIGRAAKISVHISSLRSGTASARERAAQVLAEIDKARTQGVDITADLYPYSAPESGTADPDLAAFYRHAWVMIGSDGGLATNRPSSAGAFPRVLGPIVRDEKLLTLEQAIRKSSGLPASRLGLKDRGVLIKGAAADIAVFDPATIRDKSTFEDPFARPEGMKHVFVNGVMVVKDGEDTGARPGVALR